MQRRTSSAPVRSLVLSIALTGFVLPVFAESPAETERKPSPDQPAALRKFLKDAHPETRLRAALKLTKLHEAEAIPVLIDLLAELPADRRQMIEDALDELACDEAPATAASSEDAAARRARRDAWAAWWRSHDGDTLLAAVRKQTPTAQTRARIPELIAQLGDDVFARREKASKELFALGRVALPALRDARISSDPEVMRRAGQLIERIEAAPAHHLPLATLRVLAVRKPAGTVEAILAYLPYAEDDSRAEDARKALTAMAQQDGKLAPPLLQALSDRQPLLRAAAQALARGGGTEGRDAARKLLRDEASEVRLQAALGLTFAQDRESVPVLIDLLAVLPVDGIARVENVLYQLAGDKAPRESPGTEEADRKKCRDAWAAWWKANAAGVDLAILSERPLLGYTVLCDLIGNRVYEIDRHGKQRWSIGNLQGPVDAWVLPGNRVLIAEFYGRRISEYDLKGKLLWQKAVEGHVINVQRLANGHTFAATGGGPMVEYDRAGKEVLNLPPRARQGPIGAYRFPFGPIAGLIANQRCVLMDTTGKELKSFASLHDPSHYGRIDLSPNGRILITQCTRKKVLECSRDGHKLLEVDAPDVTTASALPNGHILVACQEKQRAYELDRTGKIVWEHRNAGQIFRARRR